MGAEAPGSGQNDFSLHLEWKQMGPRSAAKSTDTGSLEQRISFRPQHFEVMGTFEYRLVTTRSEHHTTFLKVKIPNG